MRNALFFIVQVEFQGRNDFCLIKKSFSCRKKDENFIFFEHKFEFKGGKSYPWLIITHQNDPRGSCYAYIRKNPSSKSEIKSFLIWNFCMSKIWPFFRKSALKFFLVGFPAEVLLRLLGFKRWGTR